MIIDVTPTIEKANELDAAYMEMHNLPCLYVVRAINGAEETVKFTEKRLAEFVPKRTVSEMLHSWEEGLHAQHDEAMKAYHTGIHPTWTNSVRELNAAGQWTGEYIKVPHKLDAESIDIFLKKANQIKPRLGKLSFIKICR